MRMALDIHAFGFLDKPIDQKAIDDIMSDFLHYQEAQGGEALPFKTKDGLRMIYPKDILYFERQHRAIHLVMSAERFWINTPTLSAVMDQMADHDFYQIHRSYIISLKHIVRIQRETVLLENGASLPLAKGRAAEFRQVYMGQMEKRW
ncbi:LytR/AlgR family response regulator transcription factor [Eubacterium aggregans]|nr:LytTR family DNA-binding domain-containing protein [Eubacterium aggregans]